MRQLTQRCSGSGGWPMSVWLTPELKPFVGGTYYPPEDRWGRPGFKSILLRIADAWANDREKIIASANQMTQRLQRFTTVRGDPGITLEESLLDRGYQREIAAAGASVEYDGAFRWDDAENGTLRLLEWAADDRSLDRVTLGLDAARQGYW